VGGAHDKQLHLLRAARDHGLRPTPVDLGLDAGRVGLGDVGVACEAELAAALGDVLADGALRDLRTMLIDEPRVDPLRGVALLGRGVAVGLKPAVDQPVVAAEARGGSASRPRSLRRQRRGERLADGTPVDAMTLRQLADRELLSIAVAADLLEQLHSRSHPLCGLPLELGKARTVGSPSDGGGAK